MIQDFAKKDDEKGKKKKVLYPNKIAPVEYDNVRRESESTQTQVTSLPASFIPAPFGYQNNAPTGALKGFVKHSQTPIVKIIPQNEWARGKEDPTEYDFDNKTIRVREDYDSASDPAGWMVHEKAHHQFGSQDTSGQYPNNPVEERAYKEQFKYLKNKGYTFEQIFSIPTMEHKVDYKEVFKRWWGPENVANIKSFTKTAQETFQKGDLVRLIDDPNKKGIYTGKTQKDAGEMWHLIAFNMPDEHGVIDYKNKSTESQWIVEEQLVKLEKSSIESNALKGLTKASEIFSKHITIVPSSSENMRLVYYKNEFIGTVLNKQKESVWGHVDDDWGYSSNKFGPWTFGNISDPFSAAVNLFHSLKLTERVAAKIDPNIEKEPKNIEEIYKPSLEAYQKGDRSPKVVYDVQMYISLSRQEALNELKKKSQVQPGSLLVSPSVTSPNVQSLIDSPRVEIEPEIRAEIQDAVQQLTASDPGYFKGISKIVALHSGPYGQVSSDDSSIIHLNVQRIKNDVKHRLGSNFDSNNPEHREMFEEAVKQAIVEVVSHEKGHVLDYDPEKGFPGGEGVAEQESAEVVNKMFPQGLLRGFHKEALMDKEKALLIIADFADKWQDGEYHESTSSVPAAIFILIKKFIPEAIFKGNLHRSIEMPGREFLEISNVGSLMRSIRQYKHPTTPSYSSWSKSLEGVLSWTSSDEECNKMQPGEEVVKMVMRINSAEGIEFEKLEKTLIEKELLSDYSRATFIEEVMAPMEPDIQILEFIVKYSKNGKEKIARVNSFTQVKDILTNSMQGKDQEVQDRDQPLKERNRQEITLNHLRRELNNEYRDTLDTPVDKEAQIKVEVNRTISANQIYNLHNDFDKKYKSTGFVKAFSKTAGTDALPLDAKWFSPDGGHTRVWMVSEAGSQAFWQVKGDWRKIDGAHWAQGQLLSSNSKAIKEIRKKFFGDTWEAVEGSTLKSFVKMSRDPGIDSPKILFKTFMNEWATYRKELEEGCRAEKADLKKVDWANIFVDSWEDFTNRVQSTLAEKMWDQERINGFVEQLDDLFSPELEKYETASTHRKFIRTAKKLRIGIDIDGVLADTHTILMDLASKHIPIDDQDRAKYGVEDTKHGSKGLRNRVFKEIYEQGLIANVPVIAGAIEKVNELYDAGNEIYIVTARRKNWEDQTKEWLSKNGVKYHKLIMGAGGKGDVAKEENIDIFIDDSPDNIENLSGNGVKAYIFDQPWNKDSTAPRITDWKNVKAFTKQANAKVEMEDFFQERTAKHIELVNKYLDRLEEHYPYTFDKEHDWSKFEDPEHEPYLYITWKHKMEDEDGDYETPDEWKDKCDEATFHHIKNNKHHPEHWDKTLTENPINKDDRDKPSGKVVDGTKMPDKYILEMVADWCAMSEEKGNTPKKWADDNVGVRWEFSPEQKELIYEAIDLMWSTKKKATIKVFTKEASPRWTTEEKNRLKKLYLKYRQRGIPHHIIYKACAVLLNKSFLSIKQKLESMYDIDEELKPMKFEHWDKEKIDKMIQDLYRSGHPINRLRLPANLMYQITNHSLPKAQTCGFPIFYPSFDEAMAYNIVTVGFERDGGKLTDKVIKDIQEALKYYHRKEKMTHAWSKDEIISLLQDAHTAGLPLTYSFFKSHPDIYKPLIGVGRSLEGLRDSVKRNGCDWSELVIEAVPEYVDFYTDEGKLKSSTEEMRVRRFMEINKIPFRTTSNSDKIAVTDPALNEMGYKHFLPDFIITNADGVIQAIVEVFGSIADSAASNTSDIYREKRKAKENFYSTLPYKFISINNNTDGVDLTDEILKAKFATFIGA